MIDLARLEKLCKEATPGPWTSYLNLTTFHSPDGKILGAICKTGIWDKPYRSLSPNWREDLEFIIASRTALPELISEVRSLRAKLEIAEKALNIISDLAFDEASRLLARQALKKIKENSSD